MEAYAAAMEASFVYDQGAATARQPSILSPFQPINTQYSGLMPTAIDLAAIPVTALAKEPSAQEFRLLRPQLPVDDHDDLVPCPFCQQQGGSAIMSTITETSFRCNMSGFLKNLRDKPHNLCITLIDLGLHLRIPFKVYAQSTIKRGRSSLRRHCLTFVIAPQIVVHLFCRRPLTARGSIKWNDGAEPFVAMEDDMTYTLRVLGQRDPRPLPRVVLGLDAAASNLLQECGTVSDLDDDPSSGETSGRAGSPAKTPKVDDTEWCLLPDLSLKSSGDRGARIASYSFRMLMTNVVCKNLRQRASSFDIQFRTYTSSDNDVYHEERPRRLKWKVYADSTMKRGKKSMRRNDFVFPLDGYRYVVVYCKSPLTASERLALKWTEEKQEQFLAFESGLQFCIQVFSSIPTDRVTIFRSQTGDDDGRIQEWHDDINPDSEPTLEQAVMSPPIMAASPWTMTPRIWNMSLNPGATFFATLTKMTAELSAPPIVQVQVNPETIIEATLVQFDNRLRRSLIVMMPAVFSQEKVTQATTTGINLVRQVQVAVLSNPERTPLWQTPFTYEIGDNKRQPQ